MVHKGCLASCRRHHSVITSALTRQPAEIWRVWIISRQPDWSGAHPWGSNPWPRQIQQALPGQRGSLSVAGHGQGCWSPLFRTDTDHFGIAGKGNLPTAIVRVSTLHDLKLSDLTVCVRRPVTLYLLNIQFIFRIRNWKLLKQFPVSNAKNVHFKKEHNIHLKLWPK